MSIDFSTLTGLIIPEGVVTKITDASGRVLWSAIEIVVGTLYLRPSADIYVEHFLFPATSDLQAYQRINEEESDGESLYIRTDAVNNIMSPTSKFKLSNTTQLDKELIAVTGVSIMGDPIGASMSDSIVKNEFKLEINGIETESFLAETGKNIDISISAPSAIDSINEYIIEHGVLPDINIIITSYTTSGTKSDSNSGISQIYVVLTYEGY